jgi:hypothetical protein
MEISNNAAAAMQACALCSFECNVRICYVLTHSELYFQARCPQNGLTCKTWLSLRPVATNSQVNHPDTFCWARSIGMRCKMADICFKKLYVEGLGKRLRCAGTLPPEWKDLPHLKSLSVNGNNLNGMRAHLSTADLTNRQCTFAHWEWQDRSHVLRLPSCRLVAPQLGQHDTNVRT